MRFGLRVRFTNGRLNEMQVLVFWEITNLDWRCHDGSGRGGKIIEDEDSIHDSRVVGVGVV